MPAQRSEGHRRSETARIVQRGERGTLWGAGRLARFARTLVEALLEFGDQIFESVGLTSEIGGARPLRLQCFLAFGLLFLSLCDQCIDAIAVLIERGKLAFETVALR